MKKTLVVIDMQKGTTEIRYHRRYLNRGWWQKYYRVVDKIRFLATRVDNVIFLAHTGFRKRKYIQIIPGLQDLTDGVKILYKDKDDGSDVLFPYLVGKGLHNTRLFVCGMNTDACVLATACGLRDKGKSLKVEVVSDACWTVYATKSKYGHYEALKDMRENYAIPILKTKAV